MKNARRRAHRGFADEAIVLGQRLVERLVAAAVSEQAALGRGILWLLSNSGSLTWVFRPTSDLACEIDEWPVMQSLLSSYDRQREVLIVLDRYDAGCYRLHCAETKPRAANRSTKMGRHPRDRSRTR